MRQPRFLPALAVAFSTAFVVWPKPLEQSESWRALRTANRDSLLPRRALGDSEELSSLQSWMLEQGAPSSGVRFVDLPGFKFSLVAETDLKAGDVLLRVPSSLHISPSYVRGTELGKVFSSIDDSALLALGLMAEVAKGEESKWWPYIRMLPSAEDLHIPLLWPEDERRQLLKGSPLDLATEQQLLQLTEQWNDIEAVVKELPDLDLTSWTKERWLWAHAIVLTRALPFGNELSLIPGLDLANHELGSKNTCSIGVATADGQVVEATDAKQLEDNEPEAVLTAGSDHSKDDQIFIDYDGGVGLRLAWEMVHTYGFVPNNLPAYAGRPVFFEGVQPEDPFARQKQALFEALGADPSVLEGFWHELRPVGSQCRSMAPKLRLAQLSKEDGPLAEALGAWKAEPKTTYQALQKPVSEKNEERVKQQIVSAVTAALDELPKEEELKEKAASSTAEEPFQIHETLAAKVLLGERLALETCLQQWK